MSSPQPQVSDEAVEAAVPRLEDLVCAPMTGERNAKDECRQLLAAALPAIHAERDRAWMEALLSDKARRALADMVGSAYDRGSVLTLTLGAVIDAALDSLQVSGGAGLDAGDSDQRSTASAAETEAACSPAASVESSGTDKPQPETTDQQGLREAEPDPEELHRLGELAQDVEVAGCEGVLQPIGHAAACEVVAAVYGAIRSKQHPEQAEARLREVEAERDAAIEEGDRLKAAHRQAEQQLRSLLTDLQGEAERIIDSGAWETPAAAAGRLEELIRKYAALASTEQKGAGR